MAWHKRRVHIPGVGPRACDKCGLLAVCKDSDDCKEHVYRRYHCDCGNRWSTYEVRVDDEPASTE